MTTHEIVSVQDITNPETVQILIDADGKTVWVNVDGICLFRACRIKDLDVQDDREGT